MKNCTHCGEPKSLIDFHRSSQATDGRASWCKLCVNAKVRARSGRVRNSNHTQRRKWQIKSRYGLTIPQFSQMLHDQNNCCAICQADFNLQRRVHIDHSHETLRVRGLLCHRCNIRLGGWDNAEWRQRAIVYMGVFPPHNTAAENDNNPLHAWMVAA